MGYELWTSPITGYRRRGTRLEELRSLLGKGITAHAVLEPLKSCPVDAPADAMAEVLIRRDFDLAGVQARQDGPVIGYVALEALTSGRVGDHVRPLESDLLISDATPLPDVLSSLKGQPISFVLIGSQVRGIVTRADLNKPPVRVYLFGLISLLEMHLNFWIRGAHGDDGWSTSIKAERVAAAKAIFAEREKRGLETSLLECLQLCDKRDIARSNKELLDKLGIESKGAWDKLLKQVEEVRNTLAHSQHDLAHGSSWEEIIDLVERVETLVSRSDALVETAVQGAAGADGDGLWESA